MSNIINRQATASAKGYLLQSYFGIYFFFRDENYKEIDQIKIEGPLEDIEINYYDGSKDLIQVKTHETPKTKFDSEKFKKGSKTLYEALENSRKKGIKINKIILANNMRNQGIERLTKLIKEGKEDNFVYRLEEYCTEEEIEKFFKKIKQKFEPKFYLARINESYLLNSSKILPELQFITNKLELSDLSINISDSLKILFSENSCEKKHCINKSTIALVFVKPILKFSTQFNPFEKLFEKELEILGYFRIQDFIDDNNMLKLLENACESYPNFMLILKEYENYRMKNNKFNLKDMIEIITQNIIKKDILYIKGNNIVENKKMIYYFFVYCLLMRNKKIDIIFKEFNIKRRDNEIN